MALRFRAFVDLVAGELRQRSRDVSFRWDGEQRAEWRRGRFIATLSDEGAAWWLRFKVTAGEPCRYPGTYDTRHSPESARVTIENIAVHFDVGLT
jgi:hypothetical protein